MFYLTRGRGTVCKGPGEKYGRFCEPEASVVKTHLCCRSAKAAVGTVFMNGCIVPIQFMYKSRCRYELGSVLPVAVH